MKATFANYEKPTLALMFSPETLDSAQETMARAIREGVEGFCILMQALQPEFHNEEVYRKIVAAAQGLPVYMAYYRNVSNEGKPDEVLAEELLKMAECGATLCDVMGDIYDQQPGELTTDPVAVEKQKALINKLHAAGAEVLMSSHVLKFTPAERVLEIALAHQQRGADIAKIVTHADTMEQQLENLRITNLLKKELKIPFLFLSGGECKLHRRIGAMLGCCMYLCVLDEADPPVQPQLQKARAVRDSYDWDE